MNTHARNGRSVLREGVAFPNVVSRGFHRCQNFVRNFSTSKATTSSTQPSGNHVMTTIQQAAQNFRRLLNARQNNLRVDGVSSQESFADPNHSRSRCENTQAVPCH